jgi:hypothetical protein
MIIELKTSELKAKDMLRPGQGVRVYPQNGASTHTALGVIQEVITAANGDILIRIEKLVKGDECPRQWDYILAEYLDNYKEWPFELIKVDTGPDGNKRILEWKE